jgi:predicted nuclease of predicted toxin-antitoxin system
MNILVDMNLSPRWVSLLADAGIESAHWSTLGAANAPDTEIMAFAKAKGYVVLTHDLDFSAILAATQGDKPSVVQIRAENVSPDVIGKPVIDALRQMAAELTEGALPRIDPSRTRLLLLPLQPPAACPERCGDGDRIDARCLTSLLSG